MPIESKSRDLIAEEANMPPRAAPPVPGSFGKTAKRRIYKYFL
jgi:hypothetical protein